jgi:hypothetical protein
MTLKGVIRGRTIVLDHDPGLEDGLEVDVSLADPRPAENKSPFDAGSAESWKSWREELEKIKRIKPGDGLRRAAGAWGEFADEVDEFLKASRARRDVSRDPLEL